MSRDVTVETLSKTVRDEGRVRWGPYVLNLNRGMIVTIDTRQPIPPQKIVLRRETLIYATPFYKTLISIGRRAM